jgi:hypothetical protein
MISGKRRRITRRIDFMTPNETRLDDVCACSTCGRQPHVTPKKHVPMDYFVFCPNEKCPRGGFREGTLHAAKGRWTEFHFERVDLPIEAAKELAA